MFSLSLSLSLALSLALLAWSSLRTQATEIGNLVVNGEFEHDISGWTPVPHNFANWYDTTGRGNTTITSGWDGRPGWFYINDGGGVIPETRQTVTSLDPGTTYFISGYYNRDTANHGGDPFRVLVDNTQYFQAGGTPDVWTPFSFPYVATATTASLRFRSQVTGDDAYGIDGIRFSKAFTPPTQTQPTTPSVPAAPPGTKGLIYLVHGWDSDPSWWANGMKSEIETRLQEMEQSGNWTVIALDWSEAAHLWNPWWNPIPTPNLTTIQAIEIGKGIGKAISDAGFNKVHFVAHSDGAWLANAATAKIKQLAPNVQIQSTFLDANGSYTGNWLLGDGADFAEQYVNTGDSLAGLGTNMRLNQAFDVDITKIADIDDDATTNSSGLDWSTFPPTSYGHKWPYQWYTRTVNPQYSHAYDLGYNLAMEMNGDRLPSELDYPPNGLQVLPPGTTSDPVPLQSVRNDTVLNLQDLVTYQSDTGTIGRNGTALTMLTGSPVWMTSLLTVSDPVNFLTFQADFTSQPGAEGLLGVYWAGQIVGMIDERYALDGMQDYTFALAGTSDPGTYELSFRLDPYTDTASSVLVDNVATGFVVPEPATLSLLALTALCLAGYTWRRKRA